MRRDLQLGDAIGAVDRADDVRTGHRLQDDLGEIEPDGARSQVAGEGRGSPVDLERLDPPAARRAAIAVDQVPVVAHLGPGPHPVAADVGGNGHAVVLVILLVEHATAAGGEHDEHEGELHGQPMLHGRGQHAPDVILLGYTGPDDDFSRSATTPASGLAHGPWHEVADSRRT